MRLSRQRSFSSWLFLSFLFAGIFFRALNSFSASTLPGMVAASWQIEDGLPSNSIQSICQTPDGHIWIGTVNGLVRFNGVDFTPVALPPFSGTGALIVSSLCLD